MTHSTKFDLTLPAKTPRFLRILVYTVLVTLILGCEKTMNAEAPQGENASVDLNAGLNEPRNPEFSTSPHGQTTEVSLVAGSQLSDLASQLDLVAIARSSALQELQAAQAQLRSLRFDRFPQVRPVASVPLTDGRPSIGLNIEQIVWDGGRLRGRITHAELNVADANLTAWRERNATVYDGLEAYIGMARYAARIAVLADLKQELVDILALLETRLDGGVADRGELLRMNSALQSIERRIIADNSNLRQAETVLFSLLPEAGNLPVLSNLASSTSECNRSWPDSEAPIDALARIDFSRAELTENFVQAQRFPQVVLSGGSNYSQVGWSDPVIGLRLNAGDMLGFGRRGNLDAATASTRAAAATYSLQLNDTRAELASLETDYHGLAADAGTLRPLVQQNRAIIDLYKEQLDAGSLPLTEGIDLHREAADTLISLIDVDTDILLNCLRSSQRRGLLARFGFTNAER